MENGVGWEHASGSRLVSFPIRLSSPALVPLEFRYYTGDASGVDSAMEDVDYSSVAPDSNEVVNFAVGESFQTITIPVLSDEIA